MRAEMTPRDYVMEALHFYGASADLDEHGVSHIFITFPDLYQAVSWVRNMGLSREVRFQMVDLDNMTRLETEVKVIYEF
jgi:hypothetical protein